MRWLLASMMVLVSGTMFARADDRPVTADERTRLEAALQAQGCSGGRMEFDDGKFEIENAKCNDGKTYDLDFDASFALLKKKQDD